MRMWRLLGVLFTAILVLMLAFPAYAGITRKVWYGFDWDLYRIVAYSDKGEDQSNNPTSDMLMFIQFDPDNLGSTYIVSPKLEYAINKSMLKTGHNCFVPVWGDVTVLNGTIYRNGKKLSSLDRVRYEGDYIDSRTAEVILLRDSTLRLVEKEVPDEINRASDGVSAHRGYGWLEINE